MIARSVEERLPRARGFAAVLLAMLGAYFAVRVYRQLRSKVFTGDDWS